MAIASSAGKEFPYTCQYCGATYKVTYKVTGEKWNGEPFEWKFTCEGCGHWASQLDSAGGIKLTFTLTHKPQQSGPTTI